MKLYRIAESGYTVIGSRNDFERFFYPCRISGIIEKFAYEGCYCMDILIGSIGKKAPAGFKYMDSRIFNMDTAAGALAFRLRLACILGDKMNNGKNIMSCEFYGMFESEFYVRLSFRYELGIELKKDVSNLRIHIE